MSKYPSSLKWIVEAESHTHRYHAFHDNEVAFSTHKPCQHVCATAIKYQAACPNAQIPQRQASSATPRLIENITDVDEIIGHTTRNHTHNVCVTIGKQTSISEYDSQAEVDRASHQGTYFRLSECPNLMTYLPHQAAIKLATCIAATSTNKAYMPPKISSPITQKAPFMRSSFFMPRGFTMSKNRNNTRAVNAQPHARGFTTASGIHTPTISSTTTREGSSPQNGCKRFVAHVPSIVNTITSAKVTADSTKDGSQRLSSPQTIVAKTLPAVPGPHGQKPLPNPVPISIGKKGGR